MASPTSKSSSRPCIANAGSIASGLVSMALTKMACGIASIGGILLKGRVRNDAHNPLLTNRLTISSRESFSATSSPKDSKTTGSLGSGRIITESRRRFSPRTIFSTTPDTGAQIKTPGFFLSSKSGCPKITLSPSATNMVGFRPL